VNFHELFEEVIQNPKTPSEINNIARETNGVLEAKFVAFSKKRKILFLDSKATINDIKNLGYKFSDSPLEQMTGTVAKIRNKWGLIESQTLSRMHNDIQNGEPNAQKEFINFVEKFDNTWRWVERWIDFNPFITLWERDIKAMMKESKVPKKISDRVIRKKELDSMMKKGEIKHFSKEDIKGIIRKVKDEVN